MRAVAFVIAEFLQLKISCCLSISNSGRLNSASLSIIRQHIDMIRAELTSVIELIAPFRIRWINFII